MATSLCSTGDDTDPSKDLNSEIAPLNDVPEKLPEETPPSPKDLATGGQVNDLSMKRDNEQTPNDSNLTLEPYIPDPKGTIPPPLDAEKEGENNSSQKGSQNPNTHQKKKKGNRRKYIPDPTLIHFNQLFGSNTWSRFLTIKTQPTMTGAKLENILLSTYATRDMTFRSINETEWLIETTTQNQSEAYLQIDNIEGVDTLVTKHSQLNSIEGTVILPQSLDEDGLPRTDILLESLQLRYPNVQDVEVYKIPNRRNPNRSLRLAKIKFEGQSLPLDIKIEGQNRELRPHIPKPLQCKKCSKYGHSQNKCTNKSVCAYCSSKDHHTNWNCGNEEKCINCGRNHHARSKDCIFYQYNTELKMLMNRSGMTPNQGKRELKLRGIADPATMPQYRNIIERLNTTENTKPSTSTKETNETPNIPKEPKPSSSKEEQNETPKKKNQQIKISVPTENTYDILRDLTQEDIVDIQEQEMEIEPTTGVTKRSLETTPPKERTSKTIQPESKRGKREPIKPKVKRLPKTLIDEDLTPSPIIKTIIPNPHLKPNNTKQDSECESDCGECFLCLKKEVRNMTKTIHKNSCGCSECFISTCNQERHLTISTLTNIINHFITIKETPTLLSANLDTHMSGCLCREHLVHHQKTNFRNIESLLSQLQTKKNYQKGETSKPRNPKNKLTKSQSLEQIDSSNLYSRISCKTASTVNLSNLTSLT